jgi:hypothetical protein
MDIDHKYRPLLINTALDGREDSWLGGINKKLKQMSMGEHLG